MTSEDDAQRQHASTRQQHDDHVLQAIHHPHLAVALEIVRHNLSGGVIRPKASEMMPTIAQYNRVHLRRSANGSRSCRR